MSGNLRVTTDHIRDLADRQSQAAGGISQAATATEGTVASMWASHGVVCAATNMAVSTANSARTAACTAASTVSSTLSSMLETAAQQYDQTDAHEGATLGNQMTGF